MTTKGSTTRVDFSCPRTLDDFDFVTPTGPGADGNAQWLWVTSGDKQVLLSTGDPRIFRQGLKADGGAYSVEEGTFAIYRPLQISNVSLSVWFRSDDNDYVYLIARYQDPSHYYYLMVNNSSSPSPGVWDLGRVDENGIEALGRGPVPGLQFIGGRRLGLTLNGNQISPTLDGVPLGAGTYVDDRFKTGRVGVEQILMSAIEFDDLTITELAASGDYPDAGGLDGGNE